MAATIEFQVNKRETTNDQDVLVQFPAVAPAKPGTYTFELIVQDDKGVQSAPVQLNVVLQGDATAKLVALDSDLKEVNPAVFRPGAKFLLSARGSASENGEIKAFQWRLVSRP